MIRIFDIVFSGLGLIILSPVLLILYFLGLKDTGSPVFKQVRVGKDLKPFTLVKFRTMAVHTQSVATHLANQNDVTPLGNFLRKTKLDELPQLWNVFKGEMSLVGPRPNLPNQTELIESRTNHRVYSVRPGITGLAQINNIDMSTPELLAQTDAQMINSLSVKDYFSYIFFTVTGKGQGDKIRK